MLARPLLVLLFAVSGLGMVTGCARLPPRAPLAPGFEAKRLEGGWHVLASNFPMWLGGSKRDPVFIYRVRDTGGNGVELDDTVGYTESGRHETILGTDTQDPAAPAHFTWRGNGLLAAFSSDWVVSLVGPDDRFIVLYFSKTIATPEGVDVISRSPSLTPEDKKVVEKALAADSFLREKSVGIVWFSGSVASP